MSNPLGNLLTPEIMDRLGSQNTDRANSVIFLLTVDGGKFPHAAMLSPYQVVAAGPDRLLISIHRGTSSQRLLDSERRATLILQAEPRVFYVRIEISGEISWDMAEKLALYSAMPVEVLEDYSDAAPMVSELRFSAEKVGEPYQREFEEILKHIA